MILLGLDAAVDWRRFGYAIADIEDGQLILSDVVALEPGSKLDCVVAPAVEQADRALITVDAPLGWPAALGKALLGHRAGDQAHDKSP